MAITCTLSAVCTSELADAGADRRFSTPLPDGARLGSLMEVPMACGSLMEGPSGPAHTVVPSSYCSGRFAQPSERGGLGHGGRRGTVSALAGEHGEWELLAGPDRVRDKIPFAGSIGSRDANGVAVVGRHNDEGVIPKCSAARAVAGMMVA